jgi:hypothetical protein
MALIDIIRRRLQEDRVPDVPDEVGEKKKRPCVRHLEKGSRIHEKMNAEEWASLGQERGVLSK